LSQSRRISQTVGFTALLANRPVARTRHLQCFLQANEGFGSRLGVLVPKRWAPRAVDRHAFKRLVREAHLQRRVRQNLNEDLLVRLISPVRTMGLCDRKQWWSELHQLFDNIKVRP
jgi:ribonuclease P protein component